MAHTPPSGCDCGQKLVRSAVKPEFANGASVIVATLVVSATEKTRTIPCFPRSRPSPGPFRDKPTVELRHAYCLVRVVAVSIVGDRNSRRIKTYLHGRGNLA